MIKTYTKEEFLKENPELLAYNIDEIPQYVYDIIQEKVKDRGLILDYKTIIDKGLDWTFEYIYKYQPKTAEIFKRAKNPFITLRIYEERVIDGKFFVEIDGYILELRRNFYKYNLDDSKEFNEMLKNKEKITKKFKEKFKGYREYSFPLNITLAYYYHMEGMELPYSRGAIPSNIDFFLNVDTIMKYYKYKKIDRVKLLDYIQKVYFACTGETVDPKRTYAFMHTCHIGTDNKNNYFLIINDDVNFRDIYVIKNGDVKGIRRLKDPVKVIDEYIAYVLTTKETDFNFEPYLEEIPGKPEYIEEDYKEFEVNKIKINNISNENMNKVIKLLDHYKIIAFDNLYTYYRFKNAGKWYKQEKKRACNIFSEPEVNFIDIINEYPVDEFEIIQYKLIEDYDDMIEYEIGDSEEFSMYAKCNIKKGSLEIVIPSIYKRDYGVDDMKKNFTEISKDIKFSIKKVEDDKYKNIYKDKIIKYLKSFYIR